MVGIRTGLGAAAFFAATCVAGAQTATPEPSSASAAPPASVSAGSASSPGSTEQASPPSVSAPAASVVPARCFEPPAKLPDRDVDAFLNRPASLFDDPDATSARLSSRVRALAGSDSRALGALMTLAPGASAMQKAAIGSGLGRAAFACAGKEPVYSAEIQAKVAQLNVPELTLAFTTASNDIRVASIAAAGRGGAGAAAPGLSGGGAAGPGSAGMGGDEVVPTTSETYRSAARGATFITFDDDNGSDDSSDDGDPGDGGFVPGGGSSCGDSVSPSCVD